MRKFGVGGYGVSSTVVGTLLSLALIAPTLSVISVATSGTASAATTTAATTKSASVKTQTTKPVLTEKVTPHSVSTTIPGPVTGVTATPGDASGTITFNQPSTNGGSAITTYSVAYSTNGTAWTNATTSWGTGLPTSFPASVTISGLTNGTLYFIRILATNSVGNSPAVTTSITPGTTASAPLTPNQSAATLPSGANPYGQIVTGESSLAGYWPLSDTAGTTASDQSTNANNAVATSGVTLGTAGPNFSGASSAPTIASFNGSYGCVTAPN